MATKAAPARTAPSRTTPGLLIFDPTGGMSGDMFLGCLFALGVKPAEVEAEVAKLPGLEPFRIVSGRVRRQAIMATRVRVLYEGHGHEGAAGRTGHDHPNDEHHDHDHEHPEGGHAHASDHDHHAHSKAGHSHGHARDLRTILSMIRRSPLDPRVKEMAYRTFIVLGEAEGKIHGMPAGSVHFHEVGAVDSIVDIVGVAVGLMKLGFPTLYHRPFRLGSGMINIAHGRLPVPAPATLEVLKGRTVRMSRDEGEIVTPTGAALMKALASELPAEAPFIPGRIVYAAGTRERHPGPGMLRAIEAKSAGELGFVTAIRTTIDDMNPEIFGYLQEKLFGAGALEVYITNVMMKKNRPGSLLTVLCDEEARERLIAMIYEETTTLGMRITVEGRSELERFRGEVATMYGKVVVKYGVLPSGALKCAPEYESCRERAEKAGVPIAAVYDAAREAAGRPAVKKPHAVPEHIERRSLSARKKTPKTRGKR
jgi:hypothetical protein